MHKNFPLFQSHLDLAHDYWSKLVQFGDSVIDATCGNGYDTLKLCQLALTDNKGKVYAFDNQSKAIESASHYLATELPPHLIKGLEFQKRCHSTFPVFLQPDSIKLIVYNLGYLPGGDKGLTTKRLTTLQSLHQACDLLQTGGAISVTCYPGHTEGAFEQEGILDFFTTLSPKEWSCCQHLWLNRRLAPSLFFIQKNGQIQPQCGNKEEGGLLRLAQNGESPQ